MTDDEREAEMRAWTAAHPEMPHAVTAGRVLDERDALRHVLSALRDLCRRHEADRDRADAYERDLTEIGRILGCNHLADGLVRCVSDLAAAREHVAELLKRDPAAEGW